MQRHIRGSGPVPVISLAEYVSGYRQQLQQALDKPLDVQHGSEVIHTTVRLAFGRVQDEAEDLTLLFDSPQVANNIANQPVARKTANITDWVRLLKTNEMHEVLEARDGYFEAKVHVFATLANRNTDVADRALLKYLANACRQFLQAIPLTPPPNPGPNFLFWEIFGDGGHRFTPIIKYYERATDRHHEIWNSSSFSNPTALMFSISRTGGSLVKFALRLKRYMEVMERTSKLTLVEVNNLTTCTLITDSEKKYIARLFAAYGSVVGLDENENPSYENELQRRAPRLLQVFSQIQGPCYNGINSDPL